MRAADPNVTRMHIHVEPWVKSFVMAAAEEEGLTLGEYCSLVLLAGASGSLNIPQPPPAAAPIPSVSDVLRSYVEGSSLIGPCGEPSPCQYGERDSKFIGDVEFCGSCNIRVH